MVGQIDLGFTVATAAVCFKVVVLLLFIHCILLLSLFVGVLCKALLL